MRSEGCRRVGRYDGRTVRRWTDDHTAKERRTTPVVLSAAKDLLASTAGRKQILRCAQHDKFSIRVSILFVLSYWPTVLPSYSAIRNSSVVSRAGFSGSYQLMS